MEGNAKKLFFILMVIGIGGYLLMSNLKVTVTCSDENGKKQELSLEEWQEQVIKINQELIKANEELAKENDQLNKQLNQIKCLTS